MKRISAAMIVKNEEICLERCLKSIKEFDEIVIIDTGSTDGTAKVARKYTDKYFPDEYVWNDNFAEARNYAIKKCSGDWILTIDADETLSVHGVELIRKAIARTKERCFSVKCVSEVRGWEHFQPRLYRNDPKIFWKGAIHNYLNTTPKKTVDDIQVTFGNSPTHKNDPNRAMRILKKVVAEKPNCVREKFYLAREYSYRSDWIQCAYWSEEYLKKGFWGAERAEVFLLLAKALWNLNRGEEARDACLKVLKINADFEEALNFMGVMSGPKNREKWFMYAQLATNKDLLFTRVKKERSSEYYDKIFKGDGGTKRYNKIYKKVGVWAKGKVLDMGCGTAQLQKYIKDYHGFDFSPQAIKIAGNTKVWVGDIYDKKNYKKEYDTYVVIETLEHLKKDREVLAHIPCGKKVIFSVPSFQDPAHLRLYTEGILKARYKSLIGIKKIVRFNLFRHPKGDSFWNTGGEDTTAYILLAEGVRT